MTGRIFAGQPSWSGPSFSRFRESLKRSFNSPQKEFPMSNARQERCDNCKYYLPPQTVEPGAHGPGCMYNPPQQFLIGNNQGGGTQMSMIPIVVAANFCHFHEYS